MTPIGAPSTFAKPCAIATDDSSWQQVISSGFVLPPYVMSASWSARKLDPGFAQMYSRPIDFTTSTMQSAPQRSVVNASVSVDGEGVWDCADTGGAEKAAPPTTAPAVSFRNVRRLMSR